MLQLIEAQARELAEKADRVADREIAHDARNLHAAIVSLVRVELRRLSTRTASDNQNDAHRTDRDAPCSVPRGKQARQIRTGHCFDAD
ncbi:hypothetical protein [Fulvimarina sp. MAC3]|uniref:hypothetical protein n=1 Tax=Fulvimarina sp. MAC3 TaxID=3148887 RepID=UPI0031FD0E0A